MASIFITSSVPMKYCVAGQTAGNYWWCPIMSACSFTDGQHSCTVTRIRCDRASSCLIGALIQLDRPLTQTSVGVSLTFVKYRSGCEHGGIKCVPCTCIVRMSLFCCIDLRPLSLLAYCTINEASSGASCRSACPFYYTLMCTNTRRRYPRHA